MNLVKSGQVKIKRLRAGEQGWLNEVYLWEKIDIGFEYNVLAKNVLELGITNLTQNATIFHFAGAPYKPKHCRNMKQPWMSVCNKWKNYTQRLQL